jgi:N-acyl-D-amino-acid deacylase
MKFDIAILNGLVIDGAGNPWFKADIGISGDRIAKVGVVSKKDAEIVIDAKGCYVTPGFIDAHSHSDRSYVVHPNADSMVRQGITTEVVGNCGSSAYPLLGEAKERFVHEVEAPPDFIVDWSTLAEYREKVHKQGLPVNIVPLVGHGTIRTCVLGVENVQPTPQELDRMKELVRQAMEEGAFGMSTGLVYLPGCWAKTDEIIEMVKVVAEYGGIYTSHVRGERETIVEADMEAIEVGRRAGLPVQISHNAPKYGGWGKSKETLQLMEKAREEGIDVTFDNDTHTYLQTNVGGATLPQWLYGKSLEEKLQILSNPVQRAKVKDEMINDPFPRQGPAGPLKHGAFDRIVVFHAPENPDLVGKSIKEIAEMRGIDPWDAYFDLFISEKGGEGLITDYMDEEELQYISKHPLFMYCTDGSATSLEIERKKPFRDLAMCSFGEYANIIGRWTREHRVATLQETVRKCTSFPAQRFGLLDRGLIRPGMIADIVIFDYNRVRDNATNYWPHKYPFKNYPPNYSDGFLYVLVNGKIVVENEKFTGILPGKCLDYRNYRLR